MQKSKFMQELEYMQRQDYVIDKQHDYIYRMTVNRDGYFCVIQNRYGRNDGVIYGSPIQEWTFRNINSAIAKLDEIKNQPHHKTIPSTSKLMFQD